MRVGRKKVGQDLAMLKQAIQIKKFFIIRWDGRIKCIKYACDYVIQLAANLLLVPETIAAMHKIWELRKNNVEIYFTQDAGPNLKLIFLENNLHAVQEAFPQVEIINLFEVN